MQQCPTTKLALAGYSQGALVVQAALNNDGLPSDQVKAITYFGDPDSHFGTSGNVSASLIKQYCVEVDLVCELNLPVVLSPHVTYGTLYGEDAARFIINTTGVSV
ncbi:cutinase-domain-containing [Lecanosticta acicola]|uniref:Cutinase-domain-containing n=1 Tax=Lecanosticta acicola TaxID=111012 RepID=A0AAI8W0V1_9PEZI|nr:cutinase-domain-containing [Lecanosticta acicola]